MTCHDTVLHAASSQGDMQMQNARWTHCCLAVFVRCFAQSIGQKEGGMPGVLQVPLEVAVGQGPG